MWRVSGPAPRQGQWQSAQVPDMLCQRCHFCLGTGRASRVIWGSTEQGQGTQDGQRTQDSLPLTAEGHGMAGA